MDFIVIYFSKLHNNILNGLSETLLILYEKQDKEITLQNMEENLPTLDLKF